MTPEMSARLPTPPQQPPQPDRLADDLLIGASAIAAFLGVSRKAVYHMASKKRLPLGRLGKHLIARKSQLRRAIHELT